jgi:hypothetical protein
MTIQMSTALRNALVAQIESITGPSAKVQVRTGAQPANCAAADTGILLAEFALGADWSTQLAGVLTFSSVPINTAAVGNGTAAHYRLKDSTGNVCTMQGTVTVTGGGGDLTVDNATIAPAQAVQITGWTITAPGA